MIPEGWNEVAPGVLSRGEAENLAQLAQQSAPLPPESLLEVLLPQLGLEEAPPAVGERESDYFVWTIYQAEVSNAGFSTNIDMALAQSDGVSYLVLLVANPDEYESLHESVFLPVVDALMPLTVDVDYAEEEVEIENGEVTLAGTLSLPPGDGPHPAVILLTGSGPQNRDESLAPITGLRPFQLIADYLTPLGIAVLRYDDRGVGQSTGDFESATMAEFVTDGAAALAFLKNHPAIDPDQIGILGHSEGGAIAPQIAVENDVAFVISMAGSAVPGDEILLVQNRRIMETQGISDEDIAAIVEIAARAYELAIAQDPALEETVRELARLQIELTPEEDLPQIDDIDAFIEEQMPAIMEAYANDWYLHFLTYNPGDYWAQVEVPVLALFGTLDVQVDAEQNAPALESALSDNPDVEIVIFPTANHLFQDAITGGVEEYSDLDDAFVADFLPTISACILERVRVAGE